MKILYLPIFEPGAFHANAVRYKRGLYSAFCKRGHQVVEFDYLAHISTLYNDLSLLIRVHQPDLLFTQLHGADPITPAMLEALRRERPQMQVVNWSGDSHRHSLLGAPMLALMRHVNLLLVPTVDVLPDLQQAGIRAAYWNIAAELSWIEPLPEVTAYDVVFLGNVFNEQRRTLVEMLRSLPYKVGIYGDWQHADGHNTYNFPEQFALYKQAKLAIADNYRPDNLNYVSDRPMQIMAAGGALCLHQRVDRMKELTGWSKVYHYIEWDTLDDLQARITYWLKAPDSERQTRVQAACKQVLAKHTWDVRARVLFEELLPELIM